MEQEVEDEFIDIYKVENNCIYLDENLDDLPGNMQIFTLPITFTLYNCNINIINIFNYFPLHKDNIISIQTDTNVRSLKPTKNQMKPDSVVSNFMNQITLVMIIFTDIRCLETKSVNIKLFDNNSVQITGLLSIFQSNYTINKLLNLLKGDYGFFVDKNDHKKLSQLGQIDSMFLPIRFIDSDDIYITLPKLSTINLTYHYVAKINQVQFYFKIQELKLQKIIPDDVVVSFQPDIGSPVTIWLLHEDGTNITLFVFDSGIVSIMACKCRAHVLYAYDFITKILIEQHDYIIKKDIVTIIANNDDIKQYIDMEALSRVVHML